jgi:hypothetical protein
MDPLAMTRKALRHHRPASRSEEDVAGQSESLF